MTSVKIASNPYLQNITFQVLDSASGQWGGINPSSGLLRKEIVKGFLPFKAIEIIEIICREFGSSDPIEVVFEGSDDEYAELRQICDLEQYRSQVRLSRSSRWLENARDILPQVIDVFKTLQPFFDQNVTDKGKIAEDLRKFSEASNDAIPICVLGNYSAGKSTFINALIGSELLPSGDAPVTARVFQISASRQPDRGSIAFSLAGKHITLRFDASGLRPVGTWSELGLVACIRRELSDTVLGLIPSMHRALALINAARRDEEEEGVSDLIEIEAPFANDGIFGRMSNFVIFDTPGSNSATNVDHQRILQDAMEGFSNGLPIYVCEYTSLDSTDNQKLYDDIKQIEALDERFTMIVINKADEASLPREGLSEEEREQILSQAIPRNMYAQGIYFVSSIVGLGAKTHGTFENDFYAEKFEDQRRKYEDPTSRFYKQLYRYDIMPEQIKNRVVELSSHSQNVMLANSGLLSIEDAMGLFALQYSSYNKCYQSEVLLNRLIEVTAQEVASAKEKREHDKEVRVRTLDRDKAELSKKLDERVESVRSHAIESYRPSFDELAQSVCPVVHARQLNERQEELIAEEQEYQGLDRARQHEKDSFDDAKANLKHRVQDMMTSFDFAKVSDAVHGFRDDAEIAFSARSTANSVSRQSERRAASRLFEEMKDAFVERALDAMRTIDERSRAYWEEAAREARANLYRFITESDYLNEEKRSTLGEMVIGYKGIAFKELVDGMFDEERLRGIWIMDFRLFDSDTLNVERATAAFNSKMEELIKTRFEEIARNHSSGFENWLQGLHRELDENIVDYNPTLKNQEEIIQSDTQKILELEAGMHMLERYAEQVRQMMDWKAGEVPDGDR